MQVSNADAILYTELTLKTLILRTRHIRCDETNPHCRNCAAAGWKCDGVIDEPSSGDKSIVSTSTHLGMYSLTYRVPGSQRDRLMLNYFHCNGASNISGPLLAPFWTQIVFQESHQESASRHALVAYSLAHWSLTCPGSRETKGTHSEALLYYGRSLRKLQKLVDVKAKDATRTVLVCCIIFHCFESLIGDVKNAFQHLDNGIRVLSALSQRELNSLDRTGTIYNTLMQLDIQATMFNDTRPPKLQSIREQVLQGHFKHKFETLEDAQCDLLELQSHLLSFLINKSHQNRQPNSILGNTIDHGTFLQQNYDRWLLKFQIFDSQCGTEETAKARHVTLIHFRATYMLLAANLPGSQDIFKLAPSPFAEDIIRLAGEISNDDGLHSPSFAISCETGIIAPLALLAIKCQDAAISDQAIRHLRHSNRREGLFDAATIVSIVDRLTARKAQKLRVLKQQGLKEPPIKSLECWNIDVLDGTCVDIDLNTSTIPPTIIPSKNNP